MKLTIMTCLLMAAQCMPLVGARDLDWGDDLDKAKEKAAREGRDVVLLIIDEPESELLRKLVSSKKFGELVRDFVLVRLSPSYDEHGNDDTPEKTQRQVVQATIEHDALMMQSMIFLDEKGRSYGNLDFELMQNEGATVEDALKKAIQARTSRIFRDAMFESASLALLMGNKEHYVHYTSEAIRMASNLNASVLRYRPELAGMLKNSDDEDDKKRYSMFLEYLDVKMLIVEEETTRAVEAADKFVKKYKQEALDSGGNIAMLVQKAMWYQGNALIMENEIDEAIKKMNEAISMSPFSGLSYAISAYVSVLKEELRSQSGEKE